VLVVTALAHSADYDFGTGIVRLGFRGDLDVAGATKLRTAVLKSLSDHPTAALIDLNELHVLDELALLVLPALADHHSNTPIYFIADSVTETGRLMRQNSRRSTPVFHDEADVLDAIARSSHPARRFHLHLGAHEGAPRAARRLVAHACETWELANLRPVAELIASELVTNAVRHARTDTEFVVALSDKYLHLHVRDRAMQLPRLSAGDGLQAQASRGLKLVDRLAAGWGTTLAPYGKTVWATLRLRPFSAPMS
jgi:hypothetical protein